MKMQKLVKVFEKVLYKCLMMLVFDNVSAHSNIKSTLRG